jgi:hypothetical protein
VASYLQLRCHPLMIHRGVSNWPPKWQAMDWNSRPPVGEVGIIILAKIPEFYPDTCVLIMEHDSRSCMGFMTFDDRAFCCRICDLINSYAGSSTLEIGNLAVEHRGVYEIPQPLHLNDSRPRVRRS